MTKPRKIVAVRFPDGEIYPYDTCWSKSLENGHCEPLYGREGAEALHAKRRADLLALVPVGTTIKAVRTYESKSGYRPTRYRLFVVAMSQPYGDHPSRPFIREITRQVAEFVGFRLRDGEIEMSGYEYSHTFQIGYSLGLALWPNGTPEPHGTRNGEPDTCGGYAITVD